MGKRLPNVRFQKLQDFTVQIRRISSNSVIGTGIVVSHDGKIVTCAHVAKAALGAHPRRSRRKQVGIYFPHAHSEEEKSRRATIAACFPKHDDDVVLLQLVGGPPPLGSEQIAILGTANLSKGNPFSSYGYSPVGDFPATRAEGKILGPVEPPRRKKLHAQPLQLQSRQIDRGMSGAAVLDTKRNLVVGLIAARYFPATAVKDDIGYAVDASVLTLDPLKLPVRDEILKKGKAKQPKTDFKKALDTVAPDLPESWNNAPDPLPEWVGRADLLRRVSYDWSGSQCKVTGLIGFGGEGKSSLARQWVNDLLQDKSKPQPDGLFWWGFYTRPSVDEFFEAALVYMSGGDKDLPRRYRSSNAKAHLIAAMLTKGKYLYVLDGLEVMQYQEGDQYGLLKNRDIRDFLSFFARPAHRSFCLVTSRVPVLDLMHYTTYNHRDVIRLSIKDGQALLRKVGMKGGDTDLKKVVEGWDGHALTLSLLGSYVVKQHKGDIRRADEISPPSLAEDSYGRVHRVLRRYDKHLSKPERSFLTVFSAFRAPVEVSAFDKLFQAKTDAIALKVPMVKLTDTEFDTMIKHLVDYRILRYNPRECHYTTHPLIRKHYYDLLINRGENETRAVHKSIKDYYISRSPQPSLDDLVPLIEAVHHTCRSGACEEGFRLYRDRIDQGDSWILTHQLGAYETALVLMLEFFPGGRVSADPQVTDPRDKSWILNEVGNCLMCLGRLRKAVGFYERANRIRLRITKDWHKASVGYQNLAELNIHLGLLADSSQAAKEAIRLAKLAKDKKLQCDSLMWQGWSAHMRGQSPLATRKFDKAKDLEVKTGVVERYLFSLRGVYHANHLWRLGHATVARSIAINNLKICERNRWISLVSQYHRLLAALEADAKRKVRARKHYDQALKTARGISDRAVLIEALLTRGSWLARESKQAAAAFSDLNEALDYAVNSGYRIYQADIRVGLAWANLAKKDQRAAGEEAQRALRMSQDMAYHWGKVNAKKVLSRLHRKR